MDVQQNNSTMVLELESDKTADAMELPHQPSILQSSRGYFGIGIENTKTPQNLGTLWRSANLFGAAFIFTIGKRYKQQCGDTMKTDKHVPLYEYEDFISFYTNLPYNCQVVGVEMCEKSVPLPTFCHPERAIYLLGAEDYGLTKTAAGRCHHIVQIPYVKSASMNVAAAGSIVMYDRLFKKKS